MYNCECDLDLCHFDVDQAFVQWDIEEDFILRLPKGYGDLSGKIVRLKQALHYLDDVGVFRLIEDGSDYLRGYDSCGKWAYFQKMSFPAIG